MKSRLKIFLVLTAVALAASIAMGQNSANVNPKKDAKSRTDLYDKVELFADAIGILRNEYAEPVDPKKLMYGAMKGMLESLDDFSDFLEPEEYDEIKADTKGEFGGIGIEIALKEGILTVITPMAGTPGEAAGIMPEDRIVKIDGKVTKGLDINEAVKKMRGKPGTHVTLTLWREKDDKVFDITVRRDIVKVESVKKVILVEEKIGYIKIAEFQENTQDDLENALKKLEAQGMESLILDIRNNPGGLLDAAVAVSEKFLAKDLKIVSIVGRDQKLISEFKSNARSVVRSLPMVILVNHGSASGSEIVAGAMQDNKRALIVGLKTFGKASVQTVVPLRDGSALRFTSASYLTPSGRLIRDQGIAPDIIIERDAVPGDKKKEDGTDIFEKIETDKAPDGAGKAKVEISGDNQLAAAVNMMKAIMKYGSVKP